MQKGKVIFIITFSKIINIFDNVKWIKRSRIILLLRPTLVNKASHKFTGKLGQKVDKTKCGYIYKIILFIENVDKNDRIL